MIKLTKFHKTHGQAFGKLTKPFKLPKSQSPSKGCTTQGWPDGEVVTLRSAKPSCAGSNPAPASSNSL